MYKNKVLRKFLVIQKHHLKINKTVNYVNSKGRDNKGNNKPNEKKNNTRNKKNTTSKTDSINEILVSDTNPSTDVDDNDSIGWRSLPKIANTSEVSDMCDTDEIE